MHALRRRRTLPGRRESRPACRAGCSRTATAVRDRPRPCRHSRRERPAAASGLAASDDPLKCALKPSRSDGLLILASWLGSLPGSHEPCAAMMTGARSTLLFALRLDLDGLKLALALDADRAPWLQDLGAGQSAPRRAAAGPARRVRARGRSRPSTACGASAQTSPPKNPTRRISGPASAAPRIADAQPVEQGEVGRRDEFAAHLAAREIRSFR